MRCCEHIPRLELLRKDEREGSLDGLGAVCIGGGSLHCTVLAVTHPLAAEESMGYVVPGRCRGMNVSCLCAATPPTKTHRPAPTVYENIGRAVPADGALGAPFDRFSG